MAESDLDAAVDLMWERSGVGDAADRAICCESPHRPLFVYLCLWCLSLLQGQFIYGKYALLDLGDHPQRPPQGQPWSLTALRAVLPDGLGGMYRYVLQTLVSALHAEQPELEALLRESVLPVLVAAREALSVAELAWATDAPVAQVRQGRGCRTLCCKHTGPQVLQPHFPPLAAAGGAARAAACLPLPAPHWRWA